MVQEQTEAFLINAEIAPDLVLLDPPRAGLEKAVTARLLELHPREIVIVACDPSTLARDLSGLMKDYSIDRIALVDLFPQTFHMETVVKLTYSAGSTNQETT